MSEEKPPSNAPSPTSNQNLIIGLIVGAMVLLLFLLVLNMQGGNSGPSRNEVEELKSLVQTKRTQIDLERQRLGLSPLNPDGTGINIEALATKISTDSSYLATLSTTLQQALVEKTTRATAAENSLKSLYAQVDELERQVAEARAKAAESIRLQQEIANLRTQLDSERNRIAELNAQYANAPSQAALSALQSQLEQAHRERDTFRTQYLALQESTKDLEPEINRLRYEIWDLRSELNRTRLFVEKVDELPAAGKALYTELAKLETAGPSELLEAYDRINRELGASVVDTIDFPTGSSRVNLDKVNEIRRSHQSAGPGSYYLIVGYASKSGDIDKNRQLSSDRATTLATVAHESKKGNQMVQAVYFGQTDRFSSTSFEKNQICEIWEIREK